MLDLHPASDDRFRIWSHLTKREGRPLLHTFDEDIKRQSIRAFHGSKLKKHDTVTLEDVNQAREGGQNGGIAPFLPAAIPALVAGGKAMAMGGLGVAANYGTFKTWR